MSAFDQAWDLVKGFGEGFRVHGYDLDAPAVTEAVNMPTNPRLKGHKINWHDLNTRRDTGTGVTGTYYHGGPFDPLWGLGDEKNLFGKKGFKLKTHNEHTYKLYGYLFLKKSLSYRR